jgi:hypothetical protein
MQIGTSKNCPDCRQIKCKCPKQIGRIITEPKKKECKFDKYGCINEDCKEHYPIIPRASIISEMDAGEEFRKSDEEEMEHERAMNHITSCQKCQDKIRV